jgi:DnaJ-class molecular chaperone
MSMHMHDPSVYDPDCGACQLNDDEFAYAERWIECPRCGGFGEVDRRAPGGMVHSDQCSRCHGVGEVLR